MAEGHTFARITTRLTEALGSTPAVAASFSAVIAWFACSSFVDGHLANDSYQLLINTGTTIVTFLMVFIIQNTTNREARATQVKLDAILTNQKTIIQILDAAHDGNEKVDALADELMGLEDKPDGEIKAEQQRVRDA